MSYRRSQSSSSRSRQSSSSRSSRHRHSPISSNRSSSSSRSSRSNQKRSRSRTNEVHTTSTKNVGIKNETEGNQDLSFKRVKNTTTPSVNGKTDISTVTALPQRSNPLESLKTIAAEVGLPYDHQNQKPVFLTKKQRAALAAKQEEKERSVQKSQQDAIKRVREEFVRGTDRFSTNEKRKRRREETEDSSRGRSSRETSSSAALHPPAARVKEDQMKEKEAEMIKEMYLRKKNPKKRMLSLHAKFKPQFEWDASEDTSVDLNPLYSERHPVEFDYGRGFLAGVDRVEQRKKNRFYEDFNPAEKNFNQIDETKIRDRLDRDKAKAAEKQLTERHWSEKKLDQMTERDWRIFKEDFNISTRGGRVPNPLRSWNEASFPRYIQKALDDMKYGEPTPIQRQAIPIGLANKDIIGIAETGSGKTAAYIIPLLVYISKLPNLRENPRRIEEGPYSLILAPTRELVMQIHDEFEKFAQGSNFRCIHVIGGNESITEQATRIREGAEVIVATPGRLCDCIESRYLVLNQCNYVVLDEADRMLDMGFEKQVNDILQYMPSSNLKPVDYDEFDDEQNSSEKIYRQTIMFSATMPTSVEQIAANFMRKTVFVSIGDRSGKAVERITQEVIWIKEPARDNKRKKLIEILQRATPPIMIFVNTKDSCADLFAFLSQNRAKLNRLSVITIHGGKKQEQRTASLQQFKDGKADILVATDVAGRGIDVEGVTQVINFDLPNKKGAEIESYMHRIGRTGRAGKKGLATSFLTEDDKNIMYDLKKNLQETNNRIPPELDRHEAALYKADDFSARRKKPSTVFAKR